MNREKRKQRLQLKPYLDKLEMRRLMSVEVARARFGHDAVQEQKVIESQLAGGELDAFALSLAQHPRMAADLGLGALSQSLRQHAGYAQRHGWGASMVSELNAHPRYAAAHHLMAAMNSPHAPSTSPATPPATQIGRHNDTVGLARRRGLLQRPRLPSSPSARLPRRRSRKIRSSSCRGRNPRRHSAEPGPRYVRLDVHDHSPATAGQHEFQPPDRGAHLRAVGPSQAEGLSELLGRGFQWLDFRHGRRADHRHQSGRLPSTELSGQVVDENGEPLAGMPVAIGGATDGHRFVGRLHARRTFPPTPARSARAGLSARRRAGWT